jgi:hypothetical protein
MGSACRALRLPALGEYIAEWDRAVHADPAGYVGQSWCDTLAGIHSAL